MKTFDDRQQALDFARGLGAPDHLLRHLALVAEVAAELVRALRDAGVALDAGLIEAGAALHDAGKIVHPEELEGPGEAHEAAGEALLLAHDVEPRVARCCRTHSRGLELDASLEELVVGLADTLWKGQRRPDLELAVIDRAAHQLGQDRWQLFPTLDTRFEEIAAAGDARLERSRGE